MGRRHYKRSVRTTGIRRGGGMIANSTRVLVNGLIDIGYLMSLPDILAQDFVADILSREHLRFINKCIDDSKNKMGVEFGKSRWVLLAESYNSFKRLNKQGLNGKGNI